MRGPDGKWQPGSSGNPNGRPRKGFAIADALRAQLDDPVAIGPDGQIKTRRDLIVQRIIEAACKGDLTAFKLVVERVEGRAVAFNVHDFAQEDTRSGVDKFVGLVDELERLVGSPPPDDVDEYVPPADDAEPSGA